MNDITELQAVDFAVGSVISHAFDDLAENGPQNYVDFLKRPIKEKIHRAVHTDSLALIRSLSNSKKMVPYSSPDSSGEVLPALPVAAYYRMPGLSNGEEKARITDKTAWTEDVQRSLGITILPVSLEYSMTFAAFDTPTLDKMQLAWYAFVTGGRQKTRFIVPSLIGDEVLEAPANFLDPKAVFFSDSSPEKSDAGRVYSVSTSFTINTQAIVGSQIIVPDQITVEGIVKQFLT